MGELKDTSETDSQICLGQILGGINYHTESLDYVKVWELNRKRQKDELASAWVTSGQMRQKLGDQRKVCDQCLHRMWPGME